MLALDLPVAWGTDATRGQQLQPLAGTLWLVSGRTIGETVIYPEEAALGSNARPCA